MLNTQIQEPILHLKHWNSIVSSQLSTYIICMICSIPVTYVWQTQYLQIHYVYGLSSSSTNEDTSLRDKETILWRSNVYTMPLLHNKWMHISLKQPLIIYLLTVSAFSIWTSNSGSWIIDIATGSSLSPGVAIIIFSNTSGRLRRWNRQLFNMYTLEQKLNPACRVYVLKQNYLWTISSLHGDTLLFFSLTENYENQLMILILLVSIKNYYVLP